MYPDVTLFNGKWTACIKIKLKKKKKRKKERQGDRQRDVSHQCWSGIMGTLVKHSRRIPSCGRWLAHNPVLHIKGHTNYYFLLPIDAILLKAYSKDAATPRAHASSC